MGEVKSGPSCYCQNLPADVARRYKEKIEAFGICPYEIFEEDCTTDPHDFPCISMWSIGFYMVFQMSSFTYREFNAYKSLQAWSNFHCGWVQKVYCCRQNDIVAIIGQVKHSQRVGKEEARAWVLASRDGLIESAHCSCEAGLAESCSHVGSILFYVEYMVSKLAEVSPTDKECQWNVPRRVKKVEMDSIKGVDFETPKRKTKNNHETGSTISVKRIKQPSRTTTPQEREEFLSQLKSFSKSYPAPAGALLVADGYAQMAERFDKYPVSLRHLFEEKYIKMSLEEIQEIALATPLNITKKQCINLEEDTRSQSKSLLWYRMRSGRITGSNLKKVYKTSLEKPSISLLKQVVYPEKLKLTVESVQWGCHHEEHAIREYINLKNAHHKDFEYKNSGLFIHPDFPFMGATPDGVVSCACCGDGVLEVKCPHSIKDCESTESFADKVKYLKSLSDVNGGGLRLDETHEYYYQVQAEMYMADKEYCDFVVWSPKKIFCQRIYRDDVLWESVLPQCLEYFHKIVMPELLAKKWTTDLSTSLRKSKVPVRNDSPCLATYTKQQGLPEPVATQSKNRSVRLPYSTGTNCVPIDAYLKTTVPDPLRNSTNKILVSNDYAVEVDQKGNGTGLTGRVPMIVGTYVNARRESEISATETPAPNYSEAEPTTNLNVGRKQCIFQNLSSVPYPPISAGSCLKMQSTLLRGPNDIVVKCDDLSLTVMDMRTLHGKGWLNDNVINCYLKLLVERNRKSKGLPSIFCMPCHFYTFLAERGYERAVSVWARGVHIFEYDVIFLPIHLGNHWTLVTVDLRCSTVQYWDSFHNDNDKCIGIILEYLRREGFVHKQPSRHWRMTSTKDIPRQRNSWDCGMFVCLFVEHISRNVMPTFTDDDIASLRRAVFLDILERRVFYSSPEATRADKENSDPQKTPTSLTNVRPRIILRDINNLAT